MYNSGITFDQLLDTIEQLPIEKQQVLVTLLQKRLIEIRRLQIAHNAAEARHLYDTGKLPVGGVQELLSDVQNDVEA